VDRHDAKGANGTATTDTPSVTRVGDRLFELLPNGHVYGATPFHDGQWHHVATTVGEGGQKLYVDGQLVGSGKLSKRTRTSNRLGLDLGPGGDTGMVALDELRVHGRALSAEEVRKLYAAGGR